MKCSRHPEEIWTEKNPARKKKRILLFGGMRGRSFGSHENRGGPRIFYRWALMHEEGGRPPTQPPRQKKKKSVPIAKGDILDRANGKKRRVPFPSSKA